MNNLISILFLAAASATLTMTLCRSTIFAPLRRALRPYYYIHKLISCTYCTSHWTSLLVVLIAAAPASPALHTILLTTLTVTCITSPFVYLIYIMHAAAIAPTPTLPLEEELPQ